MHAPCEKLQRITMYIQLHVFASTLNFLTLLSIFYSDGDVIKWDHDEAFLCYCWLIFILWLACWYSNISISYPFLQEISVDSLILRWQLRQTAYWLFVYFILDHVFRIITNDQILKPIFSRHWPVLCLTYM